MVQDEGRVRQGCDHVECHQVIQIRFIQSIVWWYKILRKGELYGLDMWTINRSFIRSCEGEKKQREVEEDLDGQYQRRPEGENIDLTEGLANRPGTEKSGGIL